ncbi:MAG: homoserine kinase [Myxococcota bacterium]
MALPIGTTVRAFAPASVSNLGSGFDVLGLAVDGAGDTVLARRIAEPGVRLDAVRGDGGVLPTTAEANTAGIAAKATLELAGVDIGVALELDKGLPIGSGLGSSAASAVAASWAVNLLLGKPLRKRDLIEACLEAEAAIAGRHADNVAPSLLGGLVLVRRVDPLDVVRLPVPQGLVLAVITPDLVVHTKMAREVLPDAIPLPSLVSNTADIAAFVTACFTGDLTLFARSIGDAVVAPKRTELIRGGAHAIEAALAAGALGSSVSGAGPSLFAFCRSQRQAEHVARAAQDALRANGVESRVLLSPADCPGVRQV